MAQKPSIPKGTRDFSPIEVAKRTYIMNTIRTQFQRYGFQPIETPSFEKSSTLMGKYGEEGDRLIFKILDSGEYLDKIKKAIDDLKFSSHFVFSLTQKIKEAIDAEEIDYEKFKSDKIYANEKKIALSDKYELTLLFIEYYKEKKEDFLGFLNNVELATVIAFKSIGKMLELAILTKDHDLAKFEIIINDIVKNAFYDNIKSNKSSNLISEKALRYDLTVPFARYVVQHQNEIEFPFKRFQMQPVWRADRPQKGRFREFYQCDADVVGSDSLWQEVEFVQLYDAVFAALKLEGVTIKMNNRKILSGIAEVIGASDKLIDFTVALDKLDKIGKEKVIEEMLAKGISEEAIQKVDPLFTISGSFGNQLATLKELLSTSNTGMEGIEELIFINDAIESLGLESARLQLDVTLARGLNYYTGAIFEVAAPEGVAMGSIGGGGRYADLTGIFGLKDVSGVGISFGLDRIALVLEELNLFPEEAIEGTKVIFINFGKAEALYAMKAIKELRSNNIPAVLYPDAAKMKKQMTYANRREIPFVIMTGTQEMENNTFTVKDMVAGEQETMTIEALIERLK